MSREKTEAKIQAVTTWLAFFLPLDFADNISDQKSDGVGKYPYRDLKIINPEKIPVKEFLEDKV